MDWRRRGPRVGARRRARMGSGPDRVGVRGRFRADLPGDGGPRRLAGRAPRWRDARARRLARAGAAVNLDDPRAVQQGDPHRVAEILSAFPAQCRAAQALRSEPPLPRLRPSLIIIAGMGGSASGADLLAASGLPRLDVPILVHRGYGLPLTAGKDALVVAVSYSGDTAEVLSAADTALAYGVPVVTLSGGGRLAELATSRRLPHVRLPGGLMPRMALGYLFFALARVLTDADLPVATDAKLSETVNSLESLAKDLGPARATAQNEAKRLALAIGDRLPAIYGGPAAGAVAYRWETDLEENAKLPALAGTGPGMNHNEIEGLRGAPPPSPPPGFPRAGGRAHGDRRTL